MTTIVYAHGVLAADRRVTEGSSIVGDAYRKVSCTPDGWLCAWAGAVADAHQFVEWAHKGRRLSPPKGDYNSVLITPKGEVMEFENGKRLPNSRRSKFRTWGSGGDAALGALMAGATAKQAVLIAQKIDSCSGGGCDQLKLE